MTKHSRTIEASAKVSGSNIAPALSRLNRAINVGHESLRIARAAASIARSGVYRLQVRSSDSLLKDKRVVETGSIRDGKTVSDGSGSGSGGDLGSKETGNQNKPARAGGGWHRATAIVNSARVFRQIPELSRANLGGMTSDARKYVARMLASNTKSSRRARESDMTGRASFADTGVLAKVRVAPSIRGVMPPSGVSTREFARPLIDVPVSNNGSGRAANPLPSSPTVVINSAAGGAVQHDVIGALRAPREELFDQLKRESARRERAQF